MHIALTGNLGSGKSTISRIMVEKYGYDVYSTGKIQRELAAEMGLSVLEMNELMKTDAKYDHMIDDAVTRISAETTDKNIIFDSRLAWHFAVKSFKIFLSVNIDEAARRVFADNRGAVEKYSSIEDTKAQLLARAKTEDVRYHDIYNIDYFRLSNYNLVLDSTYCTPEILAEVIEQEKTRAEALGREENRILMSPRRLGAENVSEYGSGSRVAEGNVVIKSGNGDFEVVCGMELVNKAAEEGIPFVAVTCEE